jgi:general stress protein 26
MSMTKAALLEFLRSHRYGVEASNAKEGPPEAALIGFTVNERLELFFDSFDSTRKVANLRRDPRIAFVIGGHAPGDARTVQYEGEADLPTGAELEHFKSDYFAVHPDGLRRSTLPGITYFRVRPRWIRCTDFNVAPAQIVAFEGPGLGTDDGADKPAVAMPYAQVKEPWQPKIEREAVFNAFADSRARTGKLENT